MKYLIPLLLVAFLFGCKNNEKNDYPTLYVKNVTVIGMGDESKKDESIQAVNLDYFEVDLNLLENSKYNARKTMQDPNSVDDYKFKFFNVVNEDGIEFTFNNPTDFLNFMSERRYDMVDQKKEKYLTEYTFKKEGN